MQSPAKYCRWQAGETGFYLNANLRLICPNWSMHQSPPLRTGTITLIIPSISFDTSLSRSGMRNVLGADLFALSAFPAQTRHRKHRRAIRHDARNTGILHSGHGEKDDGHYTVKNNREYPHPPGRACNSRILCSQPSSAGGTYH